MLKKQDEKKIIEKLLITDIGFEGKSIGKHNGIIIFVPYGAPGDIVDVEIIHEDKKFLVGKILSFHDLSPLRIEAKCKHFGLCGGCSWQHIKYSHQLSAKQKHVKDNLERIGNVREANYLPIIASDKEFFNRNKLEFTFTNKRWILEEEVKNKINITDFRALGYHVPKRFDKVFDVEECLLQEEPSNKIRLATKEFAIKHNLEFFNLYNKTGFLRNLIIRNNSAGNFMVILVTKEFREKILKEYAEYITSRFSQITSVYVAINTKLNDSLENVEMIHLKGDKYLVEYLGDFKFQVLPNSFFQTNTSQILKMYEAAINMVNWQGNELVYDLYTGIGTIATFLSRKAQYVIGVDYSEAAINDGRRNLELNNITNVKLLHGDLSKIFKFDFVKKHGFPDVIFTDPPRAGMHKKVINTLINIGAREIVYISCNPATQARDISMLLSFYDVRTVQPVDMFPQTHHVENIVHLVKKPTVV